MFIRSYFGSIAAAANPEVDGYAAVVTGISDLVAHWRFGDTSAATLADGSGNGYDGTYPNTPTAFGALSLTLQASDGKAVSFGGGDGQVAHNAAFATLRGTLCGYFMANNLTAPRTFVNKGTGFVLQVLANGTLQLTIGTTTIATLAGAITAGVEYHIAVLWDQVAVFLCLDGRVVVWTRAHTTGLTGNNSPWQFGRTTGGANSNVRADEIALYSRRVSWTELDALSEFIRGLPYDPTPETSQVVNSGGALQTALETGGNQPGHHILVANGTYTNLTINMPAGRGGAKRRPLVVRPQGGLGAATLNYCSITVNGSWVVFAGFATTAAHSITFSPSSRYCRVTRCDGVPGGRTWNDMDGMFCRSDHNDLHDKPNGLNARRIVEVDEAYYSLNGHNYFHDMPEQTVDPNGHEMWVNGSSGADHNKFTCGVLYNNLFDRADSEGEIASIKAKGALVIRNTADNMSPPTGRTWGGRHGAQTWFESEWIEDVGAPSSQNCGQRTLGEDNVIIGSHFQNCRCALFVGSSLYSAYVDSSYPNAYNNILIGVTYAGGNGMIVIGQKLDDTPQQTFNIPVDQTWIEESDAATLVPAWQTNTTASATARIPFTPAVKLTTANVGPAAADPLVPAGYS